VGDGRIVLTIAVKDEIEQERINTQFLIAPIVATRQTITQADIVDGGTVVISGLRQEAFQNDERGIPWLSKIPVLGWLFKNDLTEATRRELVVFLTAKIVESPSQAAVSPPALPAAPGVPAPPGPSGQVPTTIQKTVSTAGPVPAVSGPGSQAPATTPKTVSAGTLVPTPSPAVRSTPAADSSGER
jgi:Flp pilus assembly secretin CpaC